MDGNGKRTEGPLAPNMFRFDASVRSYAPDPARARKLLAEAIGGQWQKAGFKPKERYLGKQFQDAYLLGLGGPTQDADELYNLVSSKGRGLNYKNDRVDELFDLGRSTLDPAKAMVEDATWVFLMQQVDIYGQRDRLHWTPRADQWMRFEGATLR